MQRIMWVVIAWGLWHGGGTAAGSGNRLAHLDDPVDPYWVHVGSPRLVTPQWVGTPGVEAVIVLAIDDLGDPEKYEAHLRPILDRLRQLRGRSALSIMSTKPDPHVPQLARWLSEGVSLEVHTVGHPCPLLQKSDLAAAKATFDLCVDLLHDIPGNHPVAFRMPCCDSMNSVSPRFFAEIFSHTTPHGRFVALDSSVFQVFTADDPQLVRQWVVDDDGQGKFSKYIPTDRNMVNYVENYPYPYVIGGTCWEFPCLMPSDWDAQHRNGKCSPQTVRDLQSAIDAVVGKHGVFSLCFHPHGWLSNMQVVELLDYADRVYGRRVEFLSFRDVVERLNRNLLAGQPLRDERGRANGVHILDVNDDGYMDVVIANGQCQQTRRWDPAAGTWQTTSFPARCVDAAAAPNASDLGVRFGIVRPDGKASVLVHTDAQQGMWHFDGTAWVADASDAGVRVPASRTAREGRDAGARLRDLDGDGICELLVSNPHEQAVWRLTSTGWERLGWALPAGIVATDEAGHDAGLRLTDLNEDQRPDVVFSNAQRAAVYLFESREQGWARQVFDEPRTAATALPPIVRADGSNNGVWFRHRRLWVQNEDTGGVTADHVVSRHFDHDLLEPQR